MDLFLDYFLIDVPEAFIALTVGLAIFNYSIRPIWKKALFFSILFGIGSFILTDLKLPYDLKIISLLLLMNLLVYLLILREPWKSVIVSTSAFGFCVFAEFFIISMFNMLSISLQEIIHNKLYLYSAVWLYLSLLLIIAYILRHFSFDLGKILPRSSRNKYLSLLILVGSIELLLILTISARFYLAQSNMINLITVENVPIFMWLILVLFLVMIYLFRVYLTLTINQVEVDTETPYIKNIQDLLTAIRSIKHDAMNHYTALDGFIKQKMYDHANDYVKLLIQEASDIVELVEGVNSPAVSSLLHSKMAICVANHINFSIKVDSDSQCASIKTNDLIKVMGNLLDNAIRATLFESDYNRYISLKWEENQLYESMTIENSGPTISQDKLDDIFELGYTTKTSGEGGVGLAVVKKVINKYNGTIQVISENDITRFCITFPK